MQRVHCQVRVGVFSCQDKYLFRYLCYCGKKTNRKWFRWSVLLSTVVAKTEFIHTPTIEIDLNSQIHLVSTSELIENDSLNRKITQAINKSVKITEYQTMNCLSFCVKTYIM